MNAARRGLGDKQTKPAVAAIWLLLACLPSANAADPKPAPKLLLEKGDHVCFIGNTLAERMQYDGHFETLLQARFPKHELVVRNLGFSADEVKFRPRSMNFGTPDQHLAMQKADVVLAFFGFNESFAGEAGLPAFEADLRDFVEHTLHARYNGRSAPRLALVSPIAHENMQNPHMPDGAESNARIALYTEVMRKVAAENGIPFVDLFVATREMMAKAKTKLTINGIHLTDEGERLVAPVLVERLFESVPKISTGAYEKLRSEVNEKNWQFFHRYRAVNGYYIYGERNRVWNNEAVMENERAKLDEMTAIRDQRVWAVAQGGNVSATIDDSHTRPHLEVISNYKEPIRILSPDEALTKFTVAKGYKINLFASEVEFPELKNPVQSAFDARGRLWVSTMPSYPGYMPPDKPNDMLVILEDTDGDGKADKRTVFADGLHVPTGFEFGDGGVYVAQQPNLMFLKDTDGDDKADVRQLVLHGFDTGDTHHAMHAFTWGPGGGLFFAEGVFHHTAVETPYGPVRNAHGGVYRFDPVSWKIETWVHYNFANPWGIYFDRWGQGFVADASGGANYYGTAFSGKAPQFTGQPDFGPFLFKHRDKMEQFFPMRIRPTCGCELVSSRQFPAEAQGNYLLNNVIGFQGVLQHTVAEKDSGFVGKEIEPLLSSSDRSFRPTALKFGPDGALYVVDWHNPLIGHLQHSIRDPNRDHSHGRVWRVTYADRPLVKPPKIAGEPIAKLLELLRTYEDRTRYNARRELRDRPAKDVIAALDKWLAGLDVKADDYEHLVLEGLWVKQHLDVVDAALLKKVLRSPDYHARAAATNVLGYWRDRVPDALGLLKVQIADEHPRVRLEAVRACSFFEERQAAEIALAALNSPTDYYITYTLKQTMRALEPFWKSAITAGQPFVADNAKATDYILASLANEDLVVMSRSKRVYEELLTRHGMAAPFRAEALAGLAKLNGTDAISELLAVMVRLDQTPGEHGAHVIGDLAQILATRPAAEVTKARDKIEMLARAGLQPITRRLAYVALITADKSADKVWAGAAASPAMLADLVGGVPLIPDAAIRASLYARVEPLLRNPDEAVRGAAIDAITSITGHESETFRTLAQFVKGDTARAAAIRGLGRIPRGKAPVAEVRPVVETLIKWVESIPPAERTKTEIVEAIRLGKDLSTVLPPAEGKARLAKLRELGVDIFIVRPIPHKMEYDRKILYVEAGKPYEILFDNTDIMPHNLVVTAPGAREEVGILAEKLAATPEGAARQFVPFTRQVLAATGMLLAGQQQRLKLTAPAKPGEYPFVCTFPGHWRTMFGTIRVVKDVSEIPLETEEPAAAGPIAEVRPFVRKWQVADLTASLDQLDKPRSAGSGKKLFAALACATCHQLRGEGGKVGPDLTEVKQKLAAKKLDRLGLITELLQPSKTIDEKFRTQVIVTLEGKLHSGVVVFEDDKVVRLLTNPLEKDVKPQEIRKDAIDERTASNVSIMPEGLLNTLTRDEILDLLDFIIKGGDAAHDHGDHK